MSITDNKKVRFTPAKRLTEATDKALSGFGIGSKKEKPAEERKDLPQARYLK